MVLVLTAAAYRIKSSRDNPAINYLTMMDRYDLGNGGVIVGCAVWSRMQQLRFSELTDRQLDMSAPTIWDEKNVTGLQTGLPFTGVDDLVCIGLFAITWLLLQLGHGALAWIRMRSPRVFDENLKDPKNQLCDNTVIPELRVKSSRGSMVELVAGQSGRLVGGATRAITRGTKRRSTRALPSDSMSA